MSKIILVDNLKENLVLTPENGICIKDFYGEFEDTELYVLREFLLKLAMAKVDDVRPVIGEYGTRLDEYL